jgi:hypothetical protein
MFSKHENASLSSCEAIKSSLSNLRISLRPVSAPLAMSAKQSALLAHTYDFKLFFRLTSDTAHYFPSLFHQNIVARMLGCCTGRSLLTSTQQFLFSAPASTFEIIHCLNQPTTHQTPTAKITEKSNSRLTTIPGTNSKPRLLPVATFAQPVRSLFAPNRQSCMLTALSEIFL